MYCVWNNWREGRGMTVWHPLTTEWCQCPGFKETFLRSWPEQRVSWWPGCSQGCWEVINGPAPRTQPQPSHLVRYLWKWRWWNYVKTVERPPSIPSSSTCSRISKDVFPALFPSAESWSHGVIASCWKCYLLQWYHHHHLMKPQTPPNESQDHLPQGSIKCTSQCCKSPEWSVIFFSYLAARVRHAPHI